MNVLVVDEFWQLVRLLSAEPDAPEFRVFGSCEPRVAQELLERSEVSIVCACVRLSRTGEFPALFERIQAKGIPIVLMTDSLDDHEAPDEATKTFRMIAKPSSVSTLRAALDALQL
jgi:DNA-binding NtrC family response regulator